MFSYFRILNLNFYDKMYKSWRLAYMFLLKTDGGCFDFFAKGLKTYDEYGKNV